MRLTDLSIDGFGVLSSFRITGLTEGLNVLYGVNGSGKTTVLHFLRGIFCGFSEPARLRLLPPLKGERPGGASRFTRRVSGVRSFGVSGPATPTPSPSTPVGREFRLPEPVAGTVTSRPRSRCCGP
jgi:energy-coupling factor transporter ATP-binding protein EcfA2